MKISEVQTILEAKIMTDNNEDSITLTSACGADLMSDVLAFVKDQSVLLTGLLNPQVIRTADMMDMVCIVFVRGKLPDESMIELAKSRDIVLMCTDLRMYSACGKLYKGGLVGLEC